MNGTVEARSDRLGAAAVLGAQRVKRPVPDGEPWRLFGMPEMGELAGPDPKKHIADHGLYRMPNGKGSAASGPAVPLNTSASRLT